MAADHVEVSFSAEGRIARGQLFPAARDRRDITVIYLAGPGRSRASSGAIAERLAADGFDVLAYDRSPRGFASDALLPYLREECATLGRALDTFGIGRAVVLGASLGGITALFCAPEDPRIRAVVAVTPFAEVEEVSPLPMEDILAAAQQIRVPVLLVDRKAEGGSVPSPSSEAVFAALGGVRELRAVAGAADGGVFRRAWPEIEEWILRLSLPPPTAA